MNYVLVIGMSISAFLMLLLRTKSVKFPADKFLILYLFFTIVLQFFFYVDYNPQLVYYNSFLQIGNGLLLLDGPLFCFYVYALTKNENLSLKKIGLNILPFILYSILYLGYYFFIFPGKEIKTINGLIYINNKLSIVWFLTIIGFFVSAGFYLYWCYRMLLEFRKSGSKNRKRELQWLEVTFYIYSISFLISLIAYPMVQYISTFSFSIFNIIFRSTYVLGTIAIGFTGLQKTSIFNPIMIDKKEKYERSGLTKTKSDIIFQKLVALMEIDKVYLNPTLNLKDLSKLLGISKNHISQVINEKKQSNFYDFINAYRVEEIKRSIENKNYERQTLLSIALECGFNSKATFNLAFKKFTGKTPSQYIKIQSFD